jgi:hypothetical protein
MITPTRSNMKNVPEIQPESMDCSNNTEIIEGYKALNDKCDLVLEKIKKRKAKQKK